MRSKKEIKSDKEIIDALFARDEAAISAVSAQYGRYLFAVASHILSDEEDCEECINDAYMKLWQSVPPDRPEDLKAYLSAIIRNIALDRYKQKSRQKRIPSDMTVSLAEIEEFVPDELGIEGRYDALLLKRAVDGFIRSLSKRRKYIFICRYYCGDSVQAIASSLDMAESTVYRELSETRKKLKEKLVKEGLWYEK